ncbi:hypothetical protein HDU79_003903 [Rhizoclosmatium sp. JEL0117]|nr:hypothetical protein HDU79_003903 [Rhizoclosmatium sp. JEL0117]
MGKKVAIIGAGLSGAVTAIALKRQGFEPTLYDKVDPIEKLKESLRNGEYNGIQFGELGGAIVLMSNGLKTLKHLGLLEPVLQLQEYPILEMYFMLIDGSDRITKNHTKAGEMDAIAVLRSKLHHTLMQAVGNAGIKSYGGKKIKDLVQTSDDVTVHFEDGSNVIADFVVGADGIHSITRRLLFPEAAKPEVVGTGYVGVVDLGTRPDGVVVDYEHRIGIYGDPLNSRFIFTSRCGKNVGDIKIFQMDPTKPFDSGEDWRPYTDLPKESALLADEVASWGTNANVVKCIRHAKRIAPVNLYDLPDLPSFHKGRVILVGDAAHGTVPMAAQGLNQAIEDGGVLGDLLGHFQDTDYKRAFELYDQIRVPRTHMCASNARGTWNRMKADNAIQAKIGRFMMRLVFTIMRIFGKDDEMFYHDFRDDVSAAVPGIQFK